LKTATNLKPMKTCKKGLHQYEGKQCKECQKVANASWYRINGEKSKAYSSARRRSDPSYILGWVESNRAKVNAYSAMRKAANRQRTPKWLTESDLIEINWAYEIARQKTLETGVIYEVDHIIPLQGKNVSGLHIPQNLQVITRTKNRQKTNNFDDIKS